MSNCPWLPPRLAPFPILAIPQGGETLAGFQKLPPSVWSQIQIQIRDNFCKTHSTTPAPIWEPVPNSCNKIFPPKQFFIFITICGIHISGSSFQIANDLCVVKQQRHFWITTTPLRAKSLNFLGGKILHAKPFRTEGVNSFSTYFLTLRKQLPPKSKRKY